jgi:hypothetical protein
MGNCKSRGATNNPVKDARELGLNGGNVPDSTSPPPQPSIETPSNARVRANAQANSKKLQNSQTPREKPEPPPISEAAYRRRVRAAESAGRAEDKVLKRRDKRCAKARKSWQPQGLQSEEAQDSTSKSEARTREPTEKKRESRSHSFP